MLFDIIKHDKELKTKGTHKAVPTSTYTSELSIYTEQADSPIKAKRQVELYIKAGAGKQTLTYAFAFLPYLHDPLNRRNLDEEEIRDLVANYVQSMRTELSRFRRKALIKYGKCDDFKTRLIDAQPSTKDINDTWVVVLKKHPKKEKQAVIDDCGLDTEILAGLGVDIDRDKDKISHGYKDINDQLKDIS